MEQAVMQKKWIWVFLSNFWRWFFQLLVGKKNYFLKKHCSVRTKKLNKKAFTKFFFKFWGAKIGCHSCFNPECNTERGFIDSLYIALGFFHLVSSKLLIIILTTVSAFCPKCHETAWNSWNHALLCSSYCERGKVSE